MAGIEDFVPSNMKIKGLTKVVLDILNMIDQINSTKEVLEKEKEEELNRNRNRIRSRSRSKDKSINNKGGRGKAQKKKKWI